MKVFEVGQKVKCIINDNSPIKLGGIYTVSEVLDETFIKLEGYERMTFTNARFVEAESTKPNNVQMFEAITQVMVSTYDKKNKDYGNSFKEQYDEYGLISSCIRLEDKLRRIKRLRTSESQIKDESIRDTLLDMANYAIMTIVAMDENELEEERPTVL